MLIACKPTSNSYSSTFDVGREDTLIYNIISIDTTDAACVQKYKFCPSIKISYPIFKSPDTVLNKYLNDEVMKALLHYDMDTINYTSIMDIIQRFFKENNGLKNEGDYDDASSEWTKEKSIHVSDKLGQYLTMEVYQDSYEGGAHPNSYTEYKVYDLISKKQAKASDIFNLSDTALLRIGEHYFREQNKITNSNLAEEGYFIFSDAPNFEDSPDYGKFRFNENFAITKDGIRFLYNAYEIAPYAVGTSNILLPFDIIQPYLKVRIW